MSLWVQPHRHIYLDTTLSLQSWEFQLKMLQCLYSSQSQVPTFQLKSIQGLLWFGLLPTPTLLLSVLPQVLSASPVSNYVSQSRPLHISVPHTWSMQKSLYPILPSPYFLAQVTFFQESFPLSRSLIDTELLLHLKYISYLANKRLINMLYASTNQKVNLVL